MPIPLQTTPSCEITGLPLPLYPMTHRELEPIIRRVSPSYTFLPADLHHHVHPSKADLLQSIAGKALRNCRVQQANYFSHHYLYHNTFTGPELPETEEEIFKFTVLAVAGVVPRDSIKLMAPGIWQRLHMNDEKYQFVKSNIGTDNHKHVGEFFADYAARQDISAIVENDALLDEFLDTSTTFDRKHEIARQLLGDAITFSLEDLDLITKQEELRREGLLIPGRSKTLRWVTKKMVRVSALGTFQQGLERQFGVAA